MPRQGFNIKLLLLPDISVCSSKMGIMGMNTKLISYKWYCGYEHLQCNRSLCYPEAAARASAIKELQNGNLCGFSNEENYRYHRRYCLLLSLKTSELFRQWLYVFKVYVTCVMICLYHYYFFSLCVFQFIFYVLYFEYAINIYIYIYNFIRFLHLTVK